MAKKKTRVMVPFQGGLRELFSVRESTKGELTIIYKQVTAMDERSASTILRHSERTTVHLSPDSADGGFLIKNEMIRKDSHVLHEYHYVFPFEGREIGPVFGTILGDLSNPGYAPNFSRAERLAILYGDALRYGGVRGTLFYFLIVSRCGLNLSDLESLPLRVQEVSFRKFKLFIVAGLFPGDSSSAATYLRYNTAPAVWNGEESELSLVAGPPYGRCARPDEIHFLIFQLLDQLISMQLICYKDIVRLTDGSKLSDSDLDHIREKFSTVYPDPFAIAGTDVQQERERLLADPPKDLWFPPSGEEDQEGCQ